MKFSGELVITPVDGQSVRLGTWQCGHCGKHHIHQPGSGKLRGICGRCKQWFCGLSCEKCVTQEAMCEVAEGTRSLTAVSVGGIWIP